MRQRVIGAIVLVAIAIIFLPMLLQGPESDRGMGDVPLDLPTPPERAFEVRELPLALPPAAPQTAAGPEPADPQASQSPAAAAGDRPDSAIVAVDTQAPARTDALDQTEPSAPEAAPAPAPAAEPIPAAAAGGDYVVQLGSYRDAGNARALDKELSDAGLPAYLEPTQSSGQTVTRLRLGPFASRGDAEAAAIRIRQLRPDLPAQVVALSAVDPASAAQRALPETGFVVQLGAFGKSEDAQSLRDRVRKAGFPAFSEGVDTDGGRLYRVRVGPEVDKASAERLRDRIKAELKLDGLVVAFP